MTDINDYYVMLTKHDWYFGWSDDHRVWSAGNQQHYKLQDIAKETADHKKLWEGFNAHYFSGEPWGTEKQPLPQPPQTTKPPDSEDK